MENGGCRALLAELTDRWSDATLFNSTQLVVWEFWCVPCECRPVRPRFLQGRRIASDTALGKRALTAGADYSREVPPGIAFSQDSSLDTPGTEIGSWPVVLTVGRVSATAAQNLMSPMGSGRVQRV
jgi:hypothetical protein